MSHAFAMVTMLIRLGCVRDEGVGDDDDLADHVSKMEEVDAVKSNEWLHVSLHRESRFHHSAVALVKKVTGGGAEA